MLSESSQTRCGFIALVGPPNSGKSTLLNALMGEKLAIVSKKPQSSQRVLKSILSDTQTQMILVDTPGINKMRAGLRGLLNDVAKIQAKEADILAWIFDVSQKDFLETLNSLAPLIKSLQFKKRLICVLNKVDKISKLSLLPMIETLSKENIFSEIIPISALKKDNLEKLRKVLLQELPPSPKLYGENQKIDRDEKFLFSEWIREKIYDLTSQEIPYTVWVEVEDWVEGRVPTLPVIIHVDSPSRKAILIGRKGEMIKEIGIRARTLIEKKLGKKICLKLQVTWEPWTQDRKELLRYLELSR